MASWMKNLNNSIANAVQGANSHVRGFQDDVGQWHAQRQERRSQASAAAAAAETPAWDPALVRPPGLTTFEVKHMLFIVCSHS
jgi:hypothetical protein